MRRKQGPKSGSRAWKLALQALEYKRSTFEGAAMHRLLMDWIAQARAADEEIRGDMRRLRARARELARNNGYLRRYFKLVQNNVVGPGGIRLEGKVVGPKGELDETTNTGIEAAWKDWSEGPVTLDGLLTLRRLESLLVKTLACDGEAFVRIWKGVDSNPYGIALEPIDADLVDETFNRKRQENALQPQNEVRMGVEIDEFGRRVGYWILKASPYLSSVPTDRYFVPASEIIHIYEPDRVNQTRGVSWLHAAMSPAHMLGGYEESEAVGARIGASQMGFFERQPESIAGELGDEDDLSTPGVMEANPGTFETVPDGYVLKAWEPKHPTTQFPSFVKTMLRKIASGLSIFYNELANDAEQVTYSTMRAFTLIERDDWKTFQQNFIDMWRRPLYGNWLGMALLTGRLKLATRDPNRYMAVVHGPRGWPWLDPQKEADGAATAIENGLGTRTGFLREKGQNIEDVFRELKREQELAKKYGIDIAPKSKQLTLKESTVDKDESTNGDGDGNRAESRVLERMGL